MRERLLLERIEQLQAEHKRAEEANKAAKEQAFRYASALCLRADAVWSLLKTLQILTHPQRQFSDSVEPVRL